MPEESGSSLNESVEGVRRAAQRKLYHELGITADQIPLEKFEFLTRIHYKAPSDEKWGEHESEFTLVYISRLSITLVWSSLNYIIMSI